MTVSLAVIAKEEPLLTEAKKLAADLGYPLVTDFTSHEYLLELSKDHLALVKPNSAFSPLFVDFLSKKMQYRCKHANFRNEILVRALGLKKNSTMTILDGTGGLGRDSFILAYLGFQVTVLERSPLIHALLKNGLDRALAHPPQAEIAKRITLLQADTITWLQNRDENERPDIIYLDPMFPERKKSAAVKKEMQLIQAIIGEDEDEKKLLSASLACAVKRVVVKRPRLADSIKGLAPSFNILGSSSRFDIYLTLGVK